MGGAIDFHSHILPGVDDGSETVIDSIEMLKQEMVQGIAYVVMTPHFYAQHDDPVRFLARRDRAEEALRAEMAKHPELPEVTVGAEVHFFRGMSESDFLPQLTIRGKSCILIEMPHGPWPEEIYRELEAVWVKHGLTPIVAHVDRYIGPFRTHKIPERLAELPVLVQANAEFFLNGFTSGMAMKMLKADQIHILGSDCHDLTSRKPNLGDALRKIERKLGRKVLERIQRYEQKLMQE